MLKCFRGVSSKKFQPVIYSAGLRNFQTSKPRVAAGVSFHESSHEGCYDFSMAALHKALLAISGEKKLRVWRCPRQEFPRTLSLRPPPACGSTLGVDGGVRGRVVGWLMIKGCGGGKPLEHLLLCSERLLQQARRGVKFVRRQPSSFETEKGKMPIKTDVLITRVTI